MHNKTGICSIVINLLWTCVILSFRRACEETMTHDLMGELEKLSRKVLINPSFPDPNLTDKINMPPALILEDQCEAPGSRSFSPPSSSTTCTGAGVADSTAAPGGARRRKRGKLVAADAGYECRPRGGDDASRLCGDAGAVEMEFVCKSCDKTFRLEQVRLFFRHRFIVLKTITILCLPF
jgi:hypothetical protein